MYDAAFFDVDGTLQSFKTRSIPDSAVKALGILRDKGIKIVLATGRHRKELAKIDAVFDFDAYITLNGQYCFDADGVFRKQAMDKEDVRVAVDHARRGLYPCYFVDEQSKYVSHLTDEIREVCRLVGAPYPEERDPIGALDTDVLQLCVYFTDADAEKYLKCYRNVEATRWHPDFMDIGPKGGSKRAGIDAVMVRYGLSPDRIIAFGDGENDIEMLKYARTGVAMGNAQPQVKEIADYVTDSVDDDGVLNAVNELLGRG